MSSDYYTILRCSPSASFEEIKRNYQELIKLHHPDKQQSNGNEKFILIDEAWKTLRDEELRRKYDAYLMEKELNDRCLVFASVNLNELDYKDDVCQYPCRCGSSYLINRNLIDSECVIECEECSYVIFVRA